MKDGHLPLLVPKTRKARLACYRRRSREDARVQRDLAALHAERAMWETQATEAKLTHERVVKRDEQDERRQQEADKARRRVANLSPDTRQMLELIGVDTSFAPADAAESGEDGAPEGDLDLDDLDADDEAAAE